ncbi:hypothetical protein TWF730_001681 [Orbilia blumenaviensis]|uniref:Uncharacterized protein n=1 Tax=Orbilia blumenaviensis TaxID=1796055 RepID=A0AAV9UID2_9PEZI
MGNTQSKNPQSVLTLPESLKGSVRYNIRTKTSDEDIGSIYKAIKFDYLDLWCVFFNDLTENGNPTPFGVPRERAWMYDTPNIPEPAVQTRYSMLRYPVLEYSCIHAMYFMKFVSMKHDEEILIKRVDLETMIERTKQLKLEFIDAIKFIIRDLAKAKQSKPWHEFGTSDPRKKEKCYLGEVLKLYGRNLNLITEAFKNMSDTIFPFGPENQESEDVAPLSAWKDAWKYEGFITNIPDWRFEDACIQSLEPFAMKTFDHEARYLMHTIGARDHKKADKEWKKSKGIMQSQPQGRISLGRHNNEPHFDDGDGKWRIDMRGKGPWKLRQLFARMKWEAEFLEKSN